MDHPNQWHGIEVLTAGQAREVAATLIAAADVLDRADGNVPPLM